MISIQEDGKIGLSIKFVDQGSGKDLDPNQVKWDQENKRGKKLQVQPSIDESQVHDPLYAMKNQSKRTEDFCIFQHSNKSLFSGNGQDSLQAGPERLCSW